jgi:phage host-nuclease inhibitor protein Gam
MAGKKKERRPVAAPQDLMGAAQCIARIGELGREIAAIDDDLNAKIGELKAEAMAKAAPNEQALEGVILDLFAFAEAKRKELELTDKDERKSCSLPTGVFGWRWNPRKVSISDAEKVLAELKRRKLKQFIRMVEDIDKQAMLKEPEEAASVKGVKITQIEHFFVKPAEAKAEIAEDAAKLRKAIAS